MSFSYDISLGTARDRIRSRLGDNDTQNVVLQDEEINAYLTLESDNEVRATRHAFRAALARLARQTDRVAIGIATSRSQRFEQMKELFALFEQESAAASGGIGVFGLTESDVTEVESDGDFILPFARVNADKME